MSYRKLKLALSFISSNYKKGGGDANTSSNYFLMKSSYTFIKRILRRSSFYWKAKYELR